MANRASYSDREDKAIVTYLAKKDMFGYVRGNAVWRLMEDDEVCPGRSFQSMRNRLLRNIINRLHTDYRTIIEQSKCRIPKFLAPHYKVQGPSLSLRDKLHQSRSPNPRNHAPESSHAASESDNGSTLIAASESDDEPIRPSSDSEPDIIENPNSKQNSETNRTSSPLKCKKRPARRLFISDDEMEVSSNGTRCSSPATDNTGPGPGIDTIDDTLNCSRSNPAVVLRHTAFPLPHSQRRIFKGMKHKDGRAIEHIVQNESSRPTSSQETDGAESNEDGGSVRTGESDASALQISPHSLIRNCSVRIERLPESLQHDQQRKSYPKSENIFQANVGSSAGDSCVTISVKDYKSMRRKRSMFLREIKHQHIVISLQRKRLREARERQRKAENSLAILLDSIRKAGNLSVEKTEMLKESCEYYCIASVFETLINAYAKHLGGTWVGAKKHNQLIDNMLKAFEPQQRAALMDKVKNMGGNIRTFPKSPKKNEMIT